MDGHVINCMIFGGKCIKKLLKEVKNMSQKTKNIIGWIMYGIGFVMYVVFLNMNDNISQEAWWNTIGACFGVLLFCISGYLRN